MKRLSLSLCVLSVTACFSANSWAAGIGIVDMQKVFQSSPQVQKMSEDLKNQFAARKAQLVKMNTELMNEIKEYQKNKTVMPLKNLVGLENKLKDQRQKLQQADMSFQHDLYAAQSEKTNKFLDEVKMSVAKVADNEKLDVVLPNRALLYSKGAADITDKVIETLKKE